MASAAQVSRVARRALVDVFAYRDYRAFLGAYFERRRAQRGGYSYAEFSAEVGLSSPNYLKLVIERERNLGADVARRFGEACGLRGEALRYFGELVAFNQAKTSAEREARYAALQGFRRFRASHRLDAAQSQYHAQWYIPAVYELCARDDFQAEPSWIASALLPAITPRQAAQALKVLQQLGLLAEDERGRWTQRETVVETPGGPLGHHVVQFHRAMMQRAAEAIDMVPRDEREIAGLTLCVSEEHMRDIKRELEAFRAQLLDRYMKDERPERVVQVNFQMFPLSGKKG